MLARVVPLVGALWLAFSWGDDATTPVRKDSLRFAVIGDSGTGDRYEQEVAQQLLRARNIFPFEFAVMMGDNLYGGEKPRDFEEKFEQPYRGLLDAGVKFYATLGN